MRLLGALACLALTGCATHSPTFRGCNVYTYLDWEGHSLSGLTYLGEEFEQKLRDLLPVDVRSQSLCWYVLEDGLVAETKQADFRQGTAYRFVRAESFWRLVETAMTFQLPPHN